VARAFEHVVRAHASDLALGGNFHLSLPWEASRREREGLATSTRTPTPTLVLDHMPISLEERRGR
jgi:hypothetical protein